MRGIDNEQPGEYGGITRTDVCTASCLIRQKEVKRGDAGLGEWIAEWMDLDSLD